MLRRCMSKSMGLGGFSNSSQPRHDSADVLLLRRPDDDRGSDSVSEAVVAVVVDAAVAGLKIWPSGTVVGGGSNSHRRHSNISPWVAAAVAAHVDFPPRAESSEKPLPPDDSCLFHPPTSPNRRRGGGRNSTPCTSWHRTEPFGVDVIQQTLGVGTVLSGTADLRKASCRSRRDLPMEGGTS
ncbi:hypothetical protein FF38_01769 [Lucilia cuprina]|uniref:Uncharacterized protein n=1 Tax=Lucilia cuprina TaxID=7375 RepID=A0A0L0CNC7_LUCCU|nr:hypothetical protein FF38_01769 [Lucilia cuprina]